MDMTGGVEAVDVSTRVIEEIAEREGVDPTDLTRPLDDVVDPEALDALFAPKTDGIDRDGCRIEFRYYGHDVVVHPDASVTVDADE